MDVMETDDEAKAAAETAHKARTKAAQATTARAAKKSDATTVTASDAVMVVVVRTTSKVEDNPRAEHVRLQRR